MLKVCLVGVGAISGAHIPAWLAMEDVKLVGICDVRPQQLEKYPDIPHYEDVKQMLDEARPDILDICLPTDLHAPVAMETMGRGIHVVSEKPISLHKEDVARLYGMAKAQDVRFMIAQVLRFWPEYEYIKELYDTGRYGKLLSGTMTRISHRPRWSFENWMADENRSGLVPFDLHIHDLDFLVYAFGKPASMNTFRSRRPEQDVLTAVYSYDGFYINCEAAWYAPDYPFQAKFRFQFEKAVVVWDGELVTYTDDDQVLKLQTGKGDTGGIQLPQTNAYAAELRYFTDCVKSHTDPDKVKPEELETVIDILRSI